MNTTGYLHYPRDTSLVEPPKIKLIKNHAKKKRKKNHQTISNLQMKKVSKTK